MESPWRPGIGLFIARRGVSLSSFGLISITVLPVYSSLFLTRIKNASQGTFKRKKTRPRTNYQQVAALLFAIKSVNTNVREEQVVIRKVK